MSAGFSLGDFSWDWSYAFSLLPRLLQGLQLTLVATVCGAVLAIALGLLWIFVRIARIPILSGCVHGLILFLRGTPFIVQLFFWFYVLPIYVVSLSPLTAGILALGLYYSSYMSEIYRAGVEAIPSGQWEACLALGLPLRRVWVGVVLPQVLKTIAPMIVNYVVVMFKESALLSTISVMEMFGQAMDVGSESFRFLEPITMAGALYFSVSYTVVRLSRRLEKRLA